jgi:hypothetical protein
MLSEIKEEITKIKRYGFDYKNEEIYEKLIDKFYSKNENYNDDKDDFIIDDIDFVFYDYLKINVYDLKTIQEIKEKRISQSKFRKELINYYKFCIISGDNFNQCQACHIEPFKKSKNNNVENGLLLNYNLHNLFDKFELGFEYINEFDENYNNYKSMNNLFKKYIMNIDYR